MQTLRDLFEHVVSANPPTKVLMRARAPQGWRSLTVEEFAALTRQTASRLAGAGVGVGDRVALFSENRPEWHIIDFACHLLGAVPVPLYATLPATQVQYIAGDCGAKVLLVSGKDRARTAVQATVGLPGIRVIGVDPNLADGVPGLDSLPLTPAPPVQPLLAEMTLASIIYTSGTTGEPKGVMLCHRNFISQIRSLQPLYPITPTDETLSFLPLCHIYARILDYLFLYCGCSMTYMSAPEKVVEYIADVKPTIMGSFPGLYEKAYVRIVSRVQHEGGLKAKVFAWALHVGRTARQAVWQGRRPGLWTQLQYALAKKVVFSKVLQRFGGRLKFTVSGGAPLAREIAEFFDIVGLPILNGYGLTESSPVITVNRLETNRLGSVGPAAPGVEIRIAEDGEILARGPNIMLGYWNKPEATKEAIDTDGWLHTGDIGHLDSGGFLFITDRKKNLIATAGGKKVAPEPIEARLRASAYIAQAVCVGDNLPYITALIVPNFENLEGYFKEHGWNGMSREKMASHQLTEALMAATVKETNADLAAFERIRRFTVLPKDFSLDAGEITPTLKVRRKIVAEHYRAVIDQMYLKVHRSSEHGLDDQEPVPSPGAVPTPGRPADQPPARTAFDAVGTEESDTRR
jgi:long-chain acyl-CoA synthetase